MLAGGQHDIGLVAAHPFAVDYEGPEVRTTKPLYYPPQPRQWVKKELRSQVEKGVLRPAVNPKVLSPIVLVPEGQSGQDYRLCISYVGVNQRTRDPAYPMPDCSQILDALVSAEIFSCIDIKAGFNNIPMESRSIPITGIISQDGCYEAMRMQFGFKAAPAHF